MAAWLAGRIGLINTMVFTHIPSSLCLIAAAFSSDLTVVLALLLVRSALSQMDVPTRSSYVMAVVTPAERTAAASVTAVPRSLASSISPAIAGFMLAGPFSGLPLVVCGCLKIGYDLALLRMFRHTKPPEEVFAIGLKALRRLQALTTVARFVRFSYTAPMTPPLLSPGSADVLLFDLGRVVLDIDFNKALTVLGRPCRLRAGRYRRRALSSTTISGITRSARSTMPRSSQACATRSASAFPTPSSWKAGTRSSPAKCPASRRCWRAPRSACRSMPSPTPTRRMSSISRQTYADVLGHFREIFLSSTIGLRKPDAAAYDHVVKAIGVPASRIVFFDDLRRQYRRRAGAGADRRSRDVDG